MSLTRLNKVAISTAAPVSPTAHEQADDPGVVEDLAAVELERLPTELGEPALDVVERAGAVGHLPQQHARREHDEVADEAEHERQLEGAPRVDVADDAGDRAHPRAPARRAQRRRRRRAGRLAAGGRPNSWSGPAPGRAWSRRRGSRRPSPAAGVGRRLRPAASPPAGRAVAARRRVGDGARRLGDGDVDRGRHDLGQLVRVVQVARASAGRPRRSARVAAWERSLRISSSAFDRRDGHVVGIAHATECRHRVMGRRWRVRSPVRRRPRPSRSTSWPDRDQATSVAPLAAAIAPRPRRPPVDARQRGGVGGALGVLRGRSAPSSTGSQRQRHRGRERRHRRARPTPASIRGSRIATSTLFRRSRRPGSAMRIAADRAALSHRRRRRR